MSTKRASLPSPPVRRLLEMAGNPPTIEEAVRKIVNDLLKGVAVAPTQLEALREPLHISEFCAEDVPFSGELRRHGKLLKVVYSVHLSESRRRFTIAHELGHALLEKADRNCGQSGNEIERLCDMVAAEILMPREVFLDKLGPTLSIARIFQLRNIFQVSLFALALRCFEFERASIFEVEKTRVRWGCGRVKKGPLQNLESWLQINIQGALELPNSAMEVYFDDKGVMYRGELEWSKLSDDRTLFLLKRNGPDREL